MPHRRALVYALFFVSGATGLVYEVVWSRLLRDVFGITAWAVAAVLATYLGGLALGSWRLGRLADRSSRPLRLYGILEIGVGVAVVLSALAVRALEPLHDLVAARLAADSPLLALARLAIAAIAVLPPTVLMGATLPAVYRYFISGVGQLGREVSSLYAINTAGAVAGSLVAGFVLVRALGVHPTLGLAAAINVGVGVVALALARSTSVGPTAAARRERVRVDGLLVAMAASGVASLALEVLWTRLLVLVVGASTHAFAIMLAVFLVGIALGGLLARSVLDRVADPRRVFGWVQAAIAASTVAVLPVVGRIVEWGQVWMVQAERDWLMPTLERFGFSLLVMLVPTTLIGMTFPLAAKIRVREVGSVAAELGLVYGANTLGNVVGALVGGFVLLPWVGIQRSLVIVALVNLGAAAWGFVSPGEGGQSPALRRRRLGVVAVGLLVCLTGAALWRPRPLRSLDERPADHTLFYDEGLVSTVKVIQRADDARELVMLVDGVRVGQSVGGIDQKQQVLAHLPFALRPRGSLRQALTIGLGSGVLAGELLGHASVEHLDVVEVSPSVVEGSRRFGRFNGDLAANPRARIITDDGIAFLARSPARWDLIVSDGKSKIEQAGNSAFFSEDFYRQAREHLTADGLMIQWMPLAEVPDALRTIVRTFDAVFPHLYVFVSNTSVFLAGMKRPLALDIDAIQQVLDESRSLRRYGWHSAIDVAAALVGDKTSVQPWLAGDSTVNSLEHPVLEFYSPWEIAVPSVVRVATNAAAMAAMHRRIAHRVVLEGPDGDELAATAGALDLFLEGLAAGENGDDAAGRFVKAGQSAPEGSAVRFAAAAALVDLARQAEAAGHRARALAWYRDAVAAWPDSLSARLSLAIALDAESASEAEEHLREALRINPESGAAHGLLGELLRPTSPVEAVGHLRAAVELAPDLPEAHLLLARGLRAAGDAEQALAELREAMRLAPRSPAPVMEAAFIQALGAETGSPAAEDAVRLAKRAVALDDSNSPGAHEVLALAYAAAGRFDDAITAQLEAIRLATAAGDSDRAQKMSAMLEQYRKH